ncbi:MAG: restriction endonuclease subunit S [Eggerthellaceae bacterium]
MLPSEKDAEAIADYLDEKTAEIDSIVSQTERSIELLREYRKSVISEAVTKGLDPDAPMRDSGVEWIGEIPAGWELCRLKQLCHMESGATPSKENLEYWDGDIPWVSSKEVKGSLISDTSLHISKEGMDSCSTRLFPVGTLAIVVRSGILKHTIPVAKLMNPMTVNQDIKALEFNEPHLSDWVQLFFQGMNDALLFALKKDGATVDSLDNGAFENCPIPVPPREEALLVFAWGSSKTAEIDSLIADKQRQVELLREYRKSLISEAVTGKFKVPGLE